MLKSLITIIAICSSTETELQQTTTIVCPNDEAVFRCSNYASSYVNWDLRDAQMQSYTVSFNGEENFFGENQSGALGSASLTAQVTFVNSTAIISTVSITYDENLNGATIACNRAITTLVLENIGSDVLPTQVNLTQLGLSYLFSAAWDTVPRKILKYFNISVSPPPLEGVSNIITNDNSAKLRLGNNTAYNLTLSANFCTGLTLRQHFFIGRCPFLFIPAVQVVYNLWFDANMTVLVKCTNGEETVLACGEIGEWDNVTGDICADTCEVPLLVANRTSTKSSKLTNDATQYLKTTEERCEQQSNSNHYNVSVMAGVAGGSLLFALLISIVAFILGVMCRVKIIEQKLTSKVVQPQPSELYYDEINTLRKTDEFKLSSNVAYGEVCKS